MIITREALINADDADYDQFDITTWGTVRIRSLSAAERLRLAEMVSGDDRTPAELFEFYARLLALSLVSESNQPLFDADNAEDLRIIQSKSWTRLEEVGKRVLRFNAMSADDEDFEKN